MQEAEEEEEEEDDNDRSKSYSAVVAQENEESGWELAYMCN